MRRLRRRRKKMMSGVGLKSRVEVIETHQFAITFSAIRHFYSCAESVVEVPEMA